MRASLYSSARDNKPAPWDGTWPELVAAISDPDDLQPHPDPRGELDDDAWSEAKRGLAAWSPAAYAPGSTRANRNVVGVHAFVVDLDDVSSEDLALTLERFSDFAYLVHDSPSAPRCAEGKRRVRLIVPLIQPVSGADWPAVWLSLVKRFGLELEGFDDGCSDPSRVYFLPCQGARFYENQGAHLEAVQRERLTTKDLTAIAGALARSKDEKRRALGRAFKAVAAGEMYAEHPHRDETLKALTWELALRRPNLDTDSVVSVFSQSMSAPGALDDDPNEERLRRLYDDAAAKVEGPDGAIVTTRPERLREAWHPLDRDTPYEDDEIRDVGRHEWVLMRGKSIYLRGPHGYAGPFGLVDGESAALTYLAPSPVRLHKMTNAGMRQRGITEIIETDGRVIAGVQVDLSAQATRYDRDTNTLYEAPCPLRPYPAEYHPEVATWLKILCGPHVDKTGRNVPDQLPYLVRWLHWLTKLQAPCAALYLCGAADTGKSLLATELAKLWTVDGVTTLETAVASFNDAIMTCPLVFGDEFVPKDKGDEIKRFVSERSRPLTRKFMPVARMVGCTRLILAANNLRFADLYGDLTADDIEAFLDRFVGIELNPEAIDYLRSVDVGAWVREGAIPKFAMWCATELKFEPQGRFLVQGARENRLHRALVTRTGTRSLFCEWLARFVASPTSGITMTKGRLLIADGRILVNVSAVRDAWELYQPKVDCPRIGQLNGAVGALSKPTRAWVGAQRYQEINLELFGAWAEENDLFDAEGLKKALDVQPKTT